MKKIIGIVGSSMIGRDPWDPCCWSRSGFNLFTMLKTKGLLVDAIGVEVPIWKRAPIMLMNYSPSRIMWSQKFNLSSYYYSLLTKEISKSKEKYRFNPDNVILQIGGHYNAAKATNMDTFSYHDGNVAGLMRSPYLPKSLRNRALEAMKFEQDVYNSLNGIFVMSEYWRKSFIEDFFVPQDKVKNIGYGVNIDIPAPNIKDEDSKNIVFIGIDFDRKGGSNLIKAFKNIVNMKNHSRASLHIVGPRQLPPSISSSGISSDRLKFHGYLSRESPADLKLLQSILNAGNIFVLPSRYEPFGNACLEAMLYGMPVLATDNWSFPDFVLPDITGALLSDPDNIEELTEQISAMLSNPEKTKTMGQNGRKLVIDNYTWESTTQKMYSTIQVS
jgi:glycosyltransferase involved in cell wall biosynthesis